MSSREDRRRVAFAFHHLYPWSVGGAERFYWALSRRMAQRQPVTLLGLRWWRGRRRIEREGVELIGLAPRPRIKRIVPILVFAVSLAAHLLRHGSRYSVVHVCCFPAAAVVAARVGLLPHRQTKLVVDWHEVLPRSTWKRRKGLLGEPAYAVQSLAIRSGDAAITFSRMHERRLREEGRRGNIYLVPEFAPDDVPLPDGAVEAPRENLIVFAGRLVGEKRPELIPAVVAELQRHDASWGAVIFGRGEHESEVAAAVARHGVGDSVRLAGFAPWSEVSRAMLSARALVFPTLREGFGLVVLEAAAHGLPSVLVDELDNASVELIVAGENGLVCPTPDPARLADAVLALASNPVIHRSAREWYERAAERYSIGNAVAALDAVHGALGAGPAVDARRERVAG